MPKIVGKLAAGDADGILMQAKALLDSNFNKNQEELNQLFASGGSEPITQEQYNSLTEYENRWYIIFKNNSLYRIYYGDTLIARKAEDGEAVSSVFPLVLPFVFV